MFTTDQQAELRELLDLYCENRISPSQIQRLEELARSDDEALRFYLDYIELHGTLIWDVAAPARPASASQTTRPTQTAGAPTSSSTTGRRPLQFSVAAVAVCLIAVAISAWVVRDNGDQHLAENDPGGADVTPDVVDVPKDRSLKPLEFGPRTDKPAPTKSGDGATGSVAVADSTQPLADGEIVAEINRLIAVTWGHAQVEATPAADRDLWTRRAYLDIVGRIPSADELASARQHRSRNALVRQLLADSGYSRSWATRWTNLLIGRSSERGVNRPAFEKFLRDGFARNTPWNETVAELIAAEGTTESNGATNFLVAHLNSQAVPATAVTARAFLGLQVQCTQCHDHPTNMTWRQHEFWELNSFFKQTRRRRVETDGPPQFVLTSTRQGGPTHYETRAGVMKTAYPRFGGQDVGAGEDVNRRRELARLITEVDNEQLARAMVNRVWAHFFGHGFTTPVDDMGPHNEPTHPDLLNLLAEQFRMADFDLRKLISWICASDAYALDSRFAENTIDAPAIGEMPLFSRAYVRQMTPEQVYDSLLVATRADQHPGFDWDSARQRRHEWIQQFTFAHANEENSETNTFNGSVTQALSMMNSELVETGISAGRGGLIADVLANHKTPTEQINAICHAVLSREPTRRELDTFRTLIRQSRGPQGRATVLQDVLWAYLNSNEFILVH